MRRFITIRVLQDFTADPTTLTMSPDDFVCATCYENGHAYIAVKGRTAYILTAAAARDESKALDDYMVQVRLETPFENFLILLTAVTSPPVKEETQQ